MSCHFRKSWAVCGPESMKAGDVVTVEKRNGDSVEVKIEAVSESFEYRGELRRYGYGPHGGTPRPVGEPAKPAQRRAKGRRRAASAPEAAGTDAALQARIEALEARLAAAAQPAAE